MKTLIVAGFMAIASFLHLLQLWRRPKPLPPTRHERRGGILDIRI